MKINPSSIKETANYYLAKITGYQLAKYRKHKRLPLIKKHADRLISFTRMFQRIEGVPGDIVECGVWRGRTLLLLSYLAEGRKVYAFDSFKGFPKDKNYPQHFQDTSLDEVRRTLCEGNSKATVSIIPGFFEDTVPNFKGQIALLHIDVDLYDAHMTCLKNLFPQVAEGGLILFDEYNEPLWPEATKAIDDFFKDKLYRLEKEKHSGKYFVIKKSRKKN